MSIIQPYMWELVWWRVTAHLMGSPSFLQMRSIEEATRGGMLLGVSYYFSITIETNTLAFSWSRPGVHWHQLSHHSKSWQNPKWISSHRIIPICTQFTHKMRCQQNAITTKNKVAPFLDEHTFRTICALLHVCALAKMQATSYRWMYEWMYLQYLDECNVISSH